MKKVLCVFLALLMVFTISIPVSAEGDLVDLPSSPSTETSLDSNSIFGLIASFFKTIIDNIKLISTDQLLDLPVESMSSIVTGIFRILDLIGFDIDGVYSWIGTLLHGGAA